MNDAPRLKILAVEAFERPIGFTHPFRFGLVTVEAAPQIYLRATIEVEGHGTAVGATAEMMMPKWFDKRPAKSVADTVADLRRSVVEAVRRANEPAGFDTAFGHSCRIHAAQTLWAAMEDITPLTASYGPAEVDKAVLDALGKATGRGFVDLLTRNAVGLDAAMTPDLDEAAIGAALKGLRPRADIAIRHTIGLVDALEGPDGLEGELARARLTRFKIKLGGDPDVDRARLLAIDGLLSRRVPDYLATLDANEQYDPERILALFDALDRDPALEGFARRLLYVEQPFDRAVTLERPLGAAAERRAFIIDEADGSYEAFGRAKALGYRGCSSKACKGLYKSILNAARARAWNREAGEGTYFLAAEDLTCQAGLGVQQDTALVAALGLDHVERNGHHYVDGFDTAPAAEAERFRAAHPDLYTVSEGRVRLDVASGRLATGSLFGPGFASGAEPDWTSLRPLSHS